MPGLQPGGLDVYSSSSQSKISYHERAHMSDVQNCNGESEKFGRQKTIENTNGSSNKPLDNQEIE